MKALLCTTLLACFFTACSSTPKGPYYDAPNSAGEYRVVYAAAPITKKTPPQVMEVSAADAVHLERIRPKLVELQAGKPALPEIGKAPGGLGFYLQGGEADKWRSLGKVGREGWVYEVASDDSAYGPKVKDARATRVLKKYVLAMEKEAVASKSMLDPTKPVIVIRPGYVKSPYHPKGAPIDVRGLPSGTEVEDPYVPGHSFLVP